MPLSDAYNKTDRLQELQMLFWRNPGRRLRTPEIAHLLDVSESTALRYLTEFEANGRLPIRKDGQVMDFGRRRHAGTVRSPFDGRQKQPLCLCLVGSLLRFMMNAILTCFRHYANWLARFPKHWLAISIVWLIWHMNATDTRKISRRSSRPLHLAG